MAVFNIYKVVNKKNPQPQWIWTSSSMHGPEIASTLRYTDISYIVFIVCSFLCQPPDCSNDVQVAQPEHKERNLIAVTALCVSKIISFFLYVVLPSRRQNFNLT
jgi:hypothetical protein